MEKEIKLLIKGTEERIKIEITTKCTNADLLLGAIILINQFSDNENILTKSTLKILESHIEEIRNLTEEEK